jgi:starch phosphorylase
VSSLHGRVSRAMWLPLFPGVREEHVPIDTSPTRGTWKSWLEPDRWKQLYDRHFGSTVLTHNGDARMWDAVDDIDDGELWETHQTLKTQLIALARRRAVMQAEHRGEPASVVAALRRALSADALTIGFARRFATYKRANLVPRRSGSGGVTGQPATEAGAIRLRRESASARPSRQGDAPADRALDARPTIYRQDTLHRRLRHQHRPLARAGRRCLVEQPAAAVGSVRHQRTEGGPERRVNLSVLDGWWAEAYDRPERVWRSAAAKCIHPRWFTMRATLTRCGMCSPRKSCRSSTIAMPTVCHAPGLHASSARFVRWLALQRHRMVMDYVTRAYIPAAGGSSSSDTWNVVPSVHPSPRFDRSRLRSPHENRARDRRHHPRHGIVGLLQHNRIDLREAQHRSGRDELRASSRVSARIIIRSRRASPDAQKFFDQGMALVFGFNHEEATRSFQRAAELDPRAPMPHWGIAWSLGPNYNLDIDDPAREARV